MNEVKHMLRAQAWARVKGELNAVLVTYYSGQDSADKDKYEKMEELTDKFISEVDGWGLAE